MSATVRSVTVRMNAEVAKYIADMKLAGRETDAAFSGSQKNLHGLNTELGSTEKRLGSLESRSRSTTSSLSGMGRGIGDVDRGVTRLDNDLGSLERRTVSTDKSINQLTGRLRLVADLTAILGPGLVPIAAVGVPALAGLTSQLTATALAGGATIIAFQGVGDAVKAVSEYDLDPTAANLEKAQAALGRLGPDALAFVGAFREFRPVLGDIRDATAAGIFPGLIESLGNVEDLAPTASRLLRDVGQAVGDAAADSTASLASERWRDFFKYLDQQAPQTIATTTRTLGDLGHGVAELIQSLDPGSDSFEAWLSRVADGFDSWASSDQGREDVEAFLDYAAENGPKVEDFFVSLVDTIAQVAQAAAPLGGPVLQGLTAASDVIGTIADSDLGTPILTGLAALSLYNRGLALTSGLLKRVGAQQAVTTATGAAGSSGMFAATRSQQAGVGAGISSILGQARAATPTLGQWGTTLYRAGQSAEYADKKTLAARESVRSFGRTVVPAAGAAAGLALVSTGLGDDLGVTNAATLALVGSIAGPWGAAIGGAVGLTKDLASANDDLVAALDRSDQALRTGGVDELRASYSELESYQRELASNPAKNLLAGVLEGVNADTVASQMAAVRRQIDGLEAGSVSGAEALSALLAPTGRLGAEMRTAAQDLDEFAASFDHLNSMLTRSGSLIAYEAALDDLTASLKENGRTWDVSTSKGRANLQARNSLVQAAIERSNELKEAGDSLGAQRILTRAISDLKSFGDQGSDARRKMRGILDELRDLTGQHAEPKVDVNDRGARRKLGLTKADLNALDMTRAEATAMLNSGPFDQKMRAATGDVKALDKQHATPVAGMNANPFNQLYGATRGDLQRLDAFTASPTVRLNDQASGAIGGIINRLGSIPRSITTTVDTYFRNHGSKGHADGGFITGPGGPREDLIPARLSNGEFVVNAAATARNRGLLEDINAQRYADGGFVQTREERALRIIRDTGGDLTTLDRGRPVGSGAGGAVRVAFEPVDVLLRQADGTTQQVRLEMKQIAQQEISAQRGLDNQMEGVA